MITYYILDGHTPIAADFMTWVWWMERADRRVAHDDMGDGGEIWTAFLGLTVPLQPCLFQTMVFGGTLDGEQERYATWEEAEAGHAAMLAKVKGATA